MSQLYDKFNVIKQLDNKIDNLHFFLDNYFESDTLTIYPDCIYQNYWYNDNVISYNIFNKYNITYLIKIKNNIKNQIKNSKYDIIFGLNKAFEIYETKAKFLNNLLKINITDSLLEFSKYILLDPIIIKNLEHKLASLNISDQNEIVKLNLNIIKINEDTYKWFLKLTGYALNSNFSDSNHPISMKYQLLYNFIDLNKYCCKIFNYYKKVFSLILSTLKKKIIYGLSTNDNIATFTFLDELIITKFTEILYKCDLDQINYLLKNFSSICYQFYPSKFDKSIYCLYYNENCNIYSKMEELLKHYLINYSKEINIIKNEDNFTYDNIFNILNLIILKKKKYDNAHILNSKPVQKYIFNIINNNINFNIDFVLKLLSLTIGIKEKDAFIISYHNNLLERLLSKNTNISNEKICIFKLDGIFPNKLMKLINDIEYTNNDLKNFYEISPLASKHNFELITTSYGNWNINYNMGFVTATSIKYNNKYRSTFSQYINSYDNFYKLRYESKRKLMWLLHYGEVNITYLENINIKLLPIQLLVLELFNDNDTLSFDEIISQEFFINYSNKFKNDLIESLIIGNIIIKNIDNIKIYQLNTNKNISNDLISIFFKNSNFIQEEKIFNYNNLILSQQNVLYCWINKLLKLKSENFNNLLLLIQEKVSLFTITQSLLKLSLDDMIKKDYITFDEKLHLYNKILY